MTNDSRLISSLRWIGWIFIICSFVRAATLSNVFRTIEDAQKSYYSQVQDNLLKQGDGQNQIIEDATLFLKASNVLIMNDVFDKYDNGVDSTYVFNCKWFWLGLLILVLKGPINFLYKKIFALLNRLR